MTNTHTHSLSNYHLFHLLPVVPIKLVMADDTSLHDVSAATCQEEVTARHAAVGQKSGNVYTQHTQVGGEVGSGGQGVGNGGGRGWGSYCSLRM